MQIESIATLTQTGTLGLFIVFYLYIAKVHSDNQARWQEFYNEQFKILNETSREIAGVLTQYSQVMTELTRQIEANTAITRRLAEQLERKQP